MPELIATITDDAYTKTSRVHITGRNGLTYGTSVPKPLVERESKRVGLSPSEFLKQYELEWLYDNFGGAFVRFMPRKNT